MHADKIRRMADEGTKDRILCARGAHIMLPGKYSSKREGIVVPQTEDGRLIFVINYGGKTMAGTTDVKTET